MYTVGFRVAGWARITILMGLICKPNSRHAAAKDEQSSCRSASEWATKHKEHQHKAAHVPEHGTL